MYNPQVTCWWGSASFVMENFMNGMMQIVFSSLVLMIIIGTRFMFAHFLRVLAPSRNICLCLLIQ
jgi:hypothetical protein